MFFDALNWRTPDLIIFCSYLFDIEKTVEGKSTGGDKVLYYLDYKLQKIKKNKKTFIKALF